MSGGRELYKSPHPSVSSSLTAQHVKILSCSSALATERLWCPTFTRQVLRITAETSLHLLLPFLIFQSVSFQGDQSLPCSFEREMMGMKRKSEELKLLSLEGSSALGQGFSNMVPSRHCWTSAPIILPACWPVLAG